VDSIAVIHPKIQQDSSLSFDPWIYKSCQSLQLLKTSVYSVQKKAMQLCRSNAAL